MHETFAFSVLLSNVESFLIRMRSIWSSVFFCFVFIDINGVGIP